MDDMKIGRDRVNKRLNVNSTGGKTRNHRGAPKRHEVY